MTLDMGNTDKLVGIPRRGRAPRHQGRAAVGQPLRRRPSRSKATRSIYALAALKGVGRAGGASRSSRRAATSRSATSPISPRRINPRAVNKRVLESLAAAGAFDYARAEPRAGVRRGRRDAGDRAAHPRGGRRSGRTTCSAAPSSRETLAHPARSSPGSPAERLQREYDAIGFFLSGHPLDEYAHAAQEAAGAVLGRVLPLGEGGRDRRPRRRDRRVAHGAAHQDRQQDGHHRPVRSDRALRGDPVRRRAAAVSRPARAGQRRCCCSSARRRRATRSAPASSRPSRSIRRPRSCRRACACSCATRRRSSRVAKRLDGKGDGEVSMVLHARRRRRGRGQAARPLQGLAADRRRHQGGARRARRPAHLACRADG